MQPPFVAATETTRRLVHPATFVDIYLERLVLYLCANLRLYILNLYWLLLVLVMLVGFCQGIDLVFQTK